MSDQEFDTLVLEICMMSGSDEDEKAFLVTLTEIESLPEFDGEKE